MALLYLLFIIPVIYDNDRNELKIHNQSQNINLDRTFTVPIYNAIHGGSRLLRFIRSWRMHTSKCFFVDVVKKT